MHLFFLSWARSRKSCCLFLSLVKGEKGTFERSFQVGDVIAAWKQRKNSVMESQVGRESAKLMCTCGIWYQIPCTKLEWKSILEY
jgi:hypothetical protein